MKVILKEQVKGLGQAGAVVEVADGYGRNFLLPRGLALEATPANMEVLKQKKAKEAAAAQKQLESARQAAGKVDGRTVTVPARAGEGGRLFGSVTAQDVADALARDTGVKVDKRRIELADTIKQVGGYQAVLRLHTQVIARISIQVTAQ